MDVYAYFRKLFAEMLWFYFLSAFDECAVK